MRASIADIRDNILVMNSLRRTIAATMTAVILLTGGCRRPVNTGNTDPSAPANTPEPSASVTPETNPASPSGTLSEAPPPAGSAIPEDTECDDKDCVVSYLIAWKKLPSNYMTKKEARKKGWSGGPLSRVVKGKTIGGDRFRNLEGQLPERDDYRECDVNSPRDARGGERLVYSDNVEVIYYTPDHYESFELVYGDEK